MNFFGQRRFKTKIEVRNRRNAKKEDGKPVLSQKQMPDAMAAELVMRALSKLGIIALVDEVTGYHMNVSGMN